MGIIFHGEVTPILARKRERTRGIVLRIISANKGKVEFAWNQPEQKWARQEGYKSRVARSRHLYRTCRRFQILSVGKNGTTGFEV